MTCRYFVGCFVLVCVLLFVVISAAASRSDLVMSFNRATVREGSELVISCDTTWNNTFLYLHFTPIDVSLGEKQIGNTRFSLRPEYRSSTSRYKWSAIGSTGFIVRIEHALPSDAGTYRCEDKLLRWDVRGFLGLGESEWEDPLQVLVSNMTSNAPETTTVATMQDDDSSGNGKNTVVAVVGGDPPVVSEKSFFDSMSSFITVIAGGILVLFIVAVTVALVLRRRSKADNEKGSLEESGYLKVNMTRAVAESPSPYEPLTTYEEPINSKGMLNHAMLADPPPIYAECIPAINSKGVLNHAMLADPPPIYAECIPAIDTNIYAECVPVVEAKSQMSGNYMEVIY
jgi:hypothetical protein